VKYINKKKRLNLMKEIEIKKSQMPEIAEIIGAFIGDGWIESNLSSLYITGHFTEDKAYYDEYLAKLFSKNLGQIKIKNFHYWSVYGIVSYNPIIIKKALRLGFQYGKKAYVAKIPEWILHSNDKKVYAAVIRGIFDTDGCFYCGKSYAPTSVEWKRTHNYIPHIFFSSCSLELINQIKLLLTFFEIKTIIKIRKAGIFNGKKQKELYNLIITKKNDVIKFFNEIGSSNPKHATKYEIWKKQGYLSPKTTLIERRNYLLQLQQISKNN